MYNVPTYTKFGLHRVPRTDHRRKSRTPCSEANPPVDFIVNITNKNTFRINHVAWLHCPSACLFTAVVPRV